MKIVLVAGDFAQSEVLNMLRQRLASLGHKGSDFLFCGQPANCGADVVRGAVRSADRVVVGMSERSDEEVAAVREAMERNIPFALYADTFGAHRLPAFECARDSDKATLFTVSANEADDAKFFFPKAKVVVTGNPCWEEFAFPKLSRNEARGILEITGEKKVIVSVGDKYLAQNIIQFGATIDAVRSLDWEEDSEILLALHPGDLHNPKLYDELVQNAGCPVRIIGKHVGINTGEILIGCDLVVEFTSTIGIRAACLRLPIIDFCSTIAMRGVKPNIAKGPWDLTKNRASFPVFLGSVRQLAEFMADLIDKGSFNSGFMLENQKKMFPVPSSEHGQAITLMCKALGA